MPKPYTSPSVADPVRPEVGERLFAHPAEVRDVLLRLRELVFEVARELSAVGELDESLKWGEPAYRPRNGAGTTVRIDWKERDPEFVAVYVPCQTDLIERWRGRFSELFEFEGNRAVKLRWREPLPEYALRACLHDALTYHRR